MKKKRRFKFDPKSIKKAEHTVVLSGVLFAAVFIAISFTAGMENVWEKFEQLTPVMWISLLGLSLVNYVGRGSKWHLFAERLKLNIPLKKMAVYYFSGMSMTVTPGKIGTALRLWFLNKGHGVSYSKGLPLMIMDPVTDLASLFIMTVVSVTAFGGGHLAGILLFGGVLVVILVLFSNPYLFQKVIKITYVIFGRRKPRLFAALQKMVRNITHLVTPKVLTGTVVFSMIGWFASICAFWYVLVQMGADVSIWQAMFVFSFSTIIGGAMMTPGGLGGTEASMVLLLVALDVPYDTALAATLVSRATTLWFGVLVGFAFLPFGMRLVSSHKTKKTAS